MATPAPKGLPPGTRLTGDAAPWFAARTTNNARYMFHTAAGRYVVLGFFGAARRPEVD